MDPLRDSLPADPLMKAKCLDHGPLMLEGMVTARGHPGGSGRLLRCSILHPRSFNLIGVTRDDRSQYRPSILACPDYACSSGRENPLVRPGDKEVAPHLSDVFIFNAKPMYPIYNQQNSV